MTSLARLWLFLLALAVTGCGFHLRGEHTLPAGIAPVYIGGLSRFDDFNRRLSAAFEVSGIKTTWSAADAATVLTLKGLGGDQFVTGVNEAGKASEYELRRHVDFELKDRASGQILVPSHSVDQRRLFSQATVIGFGKTMERDELNDQLDQEMIDSILRTISLQLRLKPVETPPPAGPVR